MTLRTHDLPKFFGFAATTVRASSDAAFRRLLDRFVSFCADSLHDRHWGEIVNVKPNNILDIQMSFQGLDNEQVNKLWLPFLRWIDDGGRDFAFTVPSRIVAIPAQQRWDTDFIRSHAPAAIITDDRPGAPNSNIFWSANLSEAGSFHPRMLFSVAARGALEEGSETKPGRRADLRSPPLNRRASFSKRPGRWF